jgi:large repetitive protein
MFKKFSPAAFRIPQLLVGALAAVALAACGGGGTAASPAQSTALTSVATTPPPVVNGTPPTSVVAGAKYDYVPSASSPDGQPLSFDIANPPAWATFSTTTGELSGTPEASDVGMTGEIEIGVSDGTSRATVGPFRIRILSASTPPNSGAPPTIAGTPAATVTAGQSYSFTPTVTNAGGEALSFAIVNLPPWASFNTATGVLTGTPTAASVGAYANILLSVSGGGANVALPAFAIQVVPAANDAPTISGTPAATVVAGTAYTFTPTATDPSGNALTFSITNAPPWTSFSASTGQLSGTPPTADVGTYSNIAITVSDGTLSASLPTFSIVVQAPANDTPTIAGTPAASVVVGNFYSFRPSTTDPAGQILVFSVLGMPSWAAFSTSTGQLSGTPASSDVGTFPGILISVSDGNESVSLPAFSIQVKARQDHAPVIGGTPPASVVAGTSYTFTPTASDPDGNALTFSIANPPSWASFSSATGKLAGTPTRAAIGTYSNIVISVSDGTESAALPAFSIAVDAPADQAPVISGTPPTHVVAGNAYGFTPTASDPDGNALTFSIANRPSWASFNSTTGQLSGTPASANVGTFSNIVISVSDGTLAASLPAFAITVAAPVDPPPTISGSPATSVGAGNPYSFTPTTTDPSGNPLTFSIQNQPSWAAFNTHTGALSGTPGAGDAGSYANIVIGVSDGIASAALASFSITVTQASSGSATLNWSAPTQNTNGTPLTNLAGFNIYYGTSAGNLNQTVHIANAGLTTYVLSELAAGTWYFSINAYSTTGAESVVSNIASKAIP